MAPGHDPQNVTPTELAGSLVDVIALDIRCNGRAKLNVYRFGAISMIIPPSEYFSTVDLKHYFNATRRNLEGGFDKKVGDNNWSDNLRDLQTLRGMPFLFGSAVGPDVLILRPEDAPTIIKFEPDTFSYVIFVQAASDRPDTVPFGFGDVPPVDNPSAQSIESNDLGGIVSTYSIQYLDETEANVPILRRFAIQQRHICWGSSPFAAMPAQGPHVYATNGEDLALGRSPVMGYATAQMRTESGRLYQGENLWLYALPNPFPEKKVIGIRLRAEAETSLVYALSTTQVPAHPLRLQLRKKLRVRLPPGMRLNVLGELDTDDRGDRIGIDLGTVISARCVLEYKTSDWLRDLPDVQPRRSDSEVIVEYLAHPAARLFLRTESGVLLVQDLSSLENHQNSADHQIWAQPIASATRPVKFMIVEKGSSQRVPARLHVHGANGEYLPPRGHNRKINVGLFEDTFAEFSNGLNQYAYVNGDCTIDLPLGPVFVAISRGFEVEPIRRIVEIDENTEIITFELKRVLRWREKGWVTADTHVHLLSPQTALLEGQAEGVNVVNLLATQWGETFSNVGDFDGRTTLGAKDFGGDGEFLVRVGTENRQQVLGHISLLGYEGRMIDPLCTGGPDESAIGDSLETTMAGWAERCRQQGGLVVMPHAPNPQAERAADIVLGLVDALEVMSMNPRRWQISAFALADWYRFLNIGYHLPLVAGSDKMDAAALLGGIRTYVHLSGRDFTFGSWMDGVRGGDTFITVGPLVNVTVEGKRPGGKIQFPSGGGKVTISWDVESVSVITKSIELIRNGLVVDEIRYNKLSFAGQTSMEISESCWLAVRVRGSVAGRAADIAAHTSAVFVEVNERPIFAPTDAISVLTQIEGSIAYLDTLAPKSDEARRARMRTALELAHHRLHHQLHRHGLGHEHTAVHSIHIGREH